jgi:hypothetical protein
VEVSPVHLERLLPDPLEFDAQLVPVDAPATEEGRAGDEADALHSPLLAPRGGLHSPTMPPLSALPPLQRSVHLSSGCRAQVGAFHLLRVRVRNVSMEPLSLVLSIHPFQESVNGQWDTQLHSKLLLVGTLTHAGTVLQPGHSCTHQLMLCFTAVGRFHFQFSAKQHDTAPVGMAPDDTARGHAAHTSKLAGSSSLVQALEEDNDPASMLRALAARVTSASTNKGTDAASSAGAGVAGAPALSLSALDTNSPLSSPAPSPLRSQSTVRRRSSLLPADGQAIAASLIAAAASSPAARAFDDGALTDSISSAAVPSSSFELDVESDSSDEETEAHEPRPQPTLLAAMQSSVVAVPSEFVHRCPNLFCVQTFL